MTATDLLATPQRVATYVLGDFVKPKNLDYPVVHVRSTSFPLGKIPKRKSTVNKFILSELELASSNLFFTSAAALQEARAATRKKLSELGYTIYSAGPRRLYVIEYNPSFRANSDAVWLYVGETGHSLDHRTSQHFSGQKAARGWEHFSHRRPDLEPSEEYWSVEDSTEAERNLGLLLSASGYRVRGPRGFDPGTGLPLGPVA